uniref:Protein krueppel n=1 Tax=Anopheles atroparvus TaxID=41427 RepID=A0A182IKG4_ANOAO
MEYPNCRNAINDPNQCRLCMRVCDDNFLECIFSDKEYSIAHQIFECTSIRVTKQDNLTKICKNCASLLFMTTEFRNACFKTNRLLMEDFVILELGDWATDSNQLMLRECENFIVNHKQQVDYLYASIVTDSEQCLEGSLEIGTAFFRSESQPPADQREVEPTGVHQEPVETRKRLEPEEPDPEILMEITKFLEEQTPSPEKHLDRPQHEHLASTHSTRATRCSLCYCLCDSMVERTHVHEEFLRALKAYDSNSQKRWICESCSLLLDMMDHFQKLILVAQQLPKDEYSLSPLARAENVCDLLRPLLDKMKLKLETYNEALCDETSPETAVKSPKDGVTVQDKQGSYKRYKITCHICGKQYDNWKLQTHLNEHDNIRPYVCDHEGCSSSFTGLVLLNRHKKLWHTDYFYAMCSVCGKKCKTQGIYQTHISYHEEPKLPCTVCGKLMRNKRAIWKHMKTHSNDRKHVCSICNKKFTIAYTLRVHMRIHTNDKPYPCAKCDKRFQYKCLLKNHDQKYHGEEAVK